MFGEEKMTTFAPDLKTKLKKMKKLILSAVVLVAAIGANAQTNSNGTAKAAASKFGFSVGVEAAIPVGTFGDAYSFGIGGSAQGDIWVAPELAITINAGYINYSGKTIGGYKVPSVGVIPIMAGIKYKFAGSGVYASGQLGTGIFTGGGSSTSSFAYAPGIGYNFSKNVDALLKYQAYSKNSSSLGSVGLRIAYTFGN